MERDSAITPDPVPSVPNGVVDILEIFDLRRLQELQDGFAAATGVASIITRPDGTPVTHPTNFCRLCSKVIRATEIGFAACMRSDAIVGSPSTQGPTVRQCLSGGLWDAGASISVNGEPVANWLIGQVRTSADDAASMLAFAREIGADEDEFAAAFDEVPLMSERQFRVIADFLFVMANQLSTSAYQNLEKTRLLADMERATASLAESEERLRRALTEAPFPVMLHTDGGEVIQVNRVWQEITGYSASDIPTIHDWTERAYGERAATLREHIGDLYGLEDRRDEGEFTIRTKRGETRVWEFNSTPLGTMPDGRRLMMSAAHDVTERKRVAKALLESERVYHNLFNSTEVAMFRSRLDGSETLNVNETFLELVGLSRDEIIGRPSADYWADRRQRDEMLRILETDGRVVDFEYKMLNSRGEVRDCITSLNLYPEEGVLAGSILDVTKRMQAERALVASNGRLEGVLKSITETMGKVVETRDPYTQGHQKGVARLSRLLAEEMGLSEEDVAAIEMAALVHDVGKLSVPAEILTKPGVLSATEFALIKVHSQSGYDILKDIDFGWPIADMVLQHHEAMDGSGYPNGSSGDEISVGARVLAVADVVDAMASHRPYRAALGIGAAAAELEDHPEKYDPLVVEAFVRLFEAGGLDL